MSKKKNVAKGTKDDPIRVRILPDKPVKGLHYQRTVNPSKAEDGRGKNLGKRKVTFKATGRSGFKKWRIVANEKVK